MRALPARELVNGVTGDYTRFPEEQGSPLILAFVVS
jgi:hypothetical protein